MHVLVEDDLGRLHLVRVWPLRRVLTRLRSGRLDRELASGHGPEEGIALAVRALQLTAGRYRRDVSFSLRYISGSIPAVSGAHDAVRARAVRRVRESEGAREALDMLADALLAPGGVPVRTIAMTCVLLCDGAGPLYNPARAGELCGEVESVLRSVRDVPAPRS